MSEAKRDRTKNDEFKSDVDTTASLLRRGYIFGQRGYDADRSINAIPDELGHSKEREGWFMGWQARYASDQAGLEPSVIGAIDNGGVPNDVGPIRT